MPKKSKEINPFDGGWNNFATARDLEENELAVATNVDCNVKGQISARPQILDIAAHPNVTYTIHDGSNDPYHNHEGLYVYNRDFNLSFGARADTEVFLFAIYDDTDGTTSDKTTRLLVADSLTNLDLDSATQLISYAEDTGGAGDRVKLNIFNSDGNLRISQGQLDNATSDNITLFYGATEKLKQADNTVTIYKTNHVEENVIGPPTNGTFYAGEMNEGLDTDDASLHLNINSVKSFTSTWFSWDVGDVGYPTTLLEDNLENPSRDELNELEVGDNNSGGASVINAGFIQTANRETGGDTLQHPTHPGTKDIYAMTFDSSEGEEAVAFINDNPIDFEDKSIFVDLWVPAEVYAIMNTTGGLTISVGSNVHISESSATNMWKFIVPSNEILEETWFTFECVYGSHDEVVGNPNSSAVDGIEFDLNMPGSTYRDSDWLMTMAVGNVKFGESSEGTWLGKYKFYYNWIYDETQYGPTKEFDGQPSGGTEYLGDILEVKTYLEPSTTDGCWDRDGFNDTHSIRITGANIFFAELDNLGEIVDNDKKFLANMDFNKGIRKNLFDNFTPFSTDGNSAVAAGRTHAKLLYKTPATIDSFSTICGYSEGDKIKHMRFGASNVLNNRSYVGNVGMIEDDLDKEMFYPDRVYKSVQNQPDVYTKYDYLEVAPNDGESITALASYGDYLLEFKENTLYLINVTQDIEYLEETYKFRGVWHENAICKTGKGLCWVNQYGLFLFDGKEVLDLGMEKMDNIYWNTNINDPSIAFDPIRNEVFLQMNKDGGEGIRYNFDRNHFIKINHDDGDLYNSMNLVTNKQGEIVTLYEGNYTNTTAHVLNTVVFMSPNAADIVDALSVIVPSLRTYIDIETKDHAFDDGSRRKDLKTVYVNYKVTGTGVPTIQYRKDNGTWRSFDVGFNNTSGAMTTLTLKPANPSEAKNGRSFQIKIYGQAQSEGTNRFTINDINLVYREKSIK